MSVNVRYLPSIFSHLAEKSRLRCIFSLLFLKIKCIFVFMDLELVSLSEEEQKDLFGEPVIPPMQKQLPHKDSNIRRERFVREYVFSGRNATEAAFVAGYGKDREASKKYGSWLLRQPDVIECLTHFQGVLNAKDLIRAEELVSAAWDTYSQVSVSRREPILTLLARMGGHLDNEKVQVNNLLSVRDLVANDAEKFSPDKSGDFSRPCAGSGQQGGGG